MFIQVLIEFHLQTYIYILLYVLDLLQRLQHRDEDITDEMEDDFYMRRLDAGLFTLQLIDLIILQIANAGASSVRAFMITLYISFFGVCLSLFLPYSISLSLSHSHTHTLSISTVYF